MFQRQKEGLLESIPEDIEGESNEKEVEVAENVFLVILLFICTQYMPRYIDFLFYAIMI